MKAIKSAKIQRQSWIYGMQQFLRAYRCTPHTTTRKAYQLGDAVLVKQPRLNKLSTPFNPTPLVVTERKGTMVTGLRGDGSKVKRIFYTFRSIPQTLIQEGDTCDDSCENILPSKKKRPRQPEETRKSRYIRLS
ncbi:hypothetical protein P5673_029999 [Acropora cervicornis]|uniref:Uncharacterized protein n=1 Tax=Acropora cervicornis TaxID=6130 RepID=A0AAD9UTK8_ACRCE|nr:hypothetical protein P5673_029999 [Acropora cervicornis]